MAERAWPVGIHRDYSDEPFESLVAKLEAYALIKEALHLVSDYLKVSENRGQKLVLHIVIELI